jgi:signal transduction histidine kinase
MIYTSNRILKRISEIKTIFNKIVGFRFTLLMFSINLFFTLSFSQNLSDSLYQELYFLAQVDTNKYTKFKNEITEKLELTEEDRYRILELDGNKFHNHGDDYTAKKIYSDVNKYAKENKIVDLELSTRIKNIWLDLGLGLIKLQEAVVKMNRAKSDAIIAKDTSRIVMSYNALASYQLSLGKPEEASKYFYEGLKISQNPKYFLDRATILNNLGLLKSDQGLSEDAMSDFKEGLRLIENKKEIRIQTRLINNIAFMFNRDSSKRDSAYYYFNKTLELGKIIEEPSLFIVSYTNLAVYNNFAGNPEICLQYYDSALAVIETYDMVGMRGKIFLGMADNYRRQKMYTKALSTLNKGWEFVKTESYQKLEDMMSYEKFYSSIYDNMGNYEKSLIHYKQYNSHRDSMREMNDQKFLKELNLKYEDEKRIAEIEKQKDRADLAEKKQEIIQTESSLNLMRNSVIFVSIIFIIVFLFFIYAYRSIKAKKVMEQKYAANLISNIEDERRRISSDLHDHIGLNLILIKNELNKKSENDRVVNDVTKIVEDVRKISRNIYPSKLNKLGIRKSLESMLDKIEETSGIIVSYELEDLDQIDFEKGEELILYRIVQELSNNSIKHSQSKSIRLTTKLSSKKLNLQYLDNGIGFDKSKILETSSGMGLRNIINRAERIGGSITIDSKKGQGIKVNIKFERNN